MMPLHQWRTVGVVTECGRYDVQDIRIKRPDNWNDARREFMRDEPVSCAECLRVVAEHVERCRIKPPLRGDEATQAWLDAEQAAEDARNGGGR